MSDNRLNIITESSSEDSSFISSPSLSRSNRIREMQAKFERLWLVDPERFNPLRNCMERERLERTWHLLKHHTDFASKQTADIGCGMGIFSRRLRDAGAQVEAVDIAENALKYLHEEDNHHIHLKQDAMPTTTLPDHHYDIIVCTELIAELPQDDHRLFFAELSRLIRPEGYLICSSAIDIDSEGGVEKLIELAQTEFDILGAVASYHALYLRIKRFVEAPTGFIKGWENLEFKREEMRHRRGLNRWWFWLNSTAFVWIWYVLNPLMTPLRQSLKNSCKLLLWLERICRFLKSDAGISHYLFIAKRRPLKAIDPREIPVEKPKRKEIWD